MDGDVSDLMMGTLSGNERDDFGKSQDQRNVLLLDRTMQRSRDPTSRLLQLPTELLANIVELLGNDYSALANLALVNIECRQLARTRQFCEIRFDYGKNCRNLLNHLLKEVAVRRTAAKTSSVVTEKPTISTCIRHVTVASHPGWVRAYHYDLYDSIWGASAGSVGREERQALEHQAREGYVAYRDRLLMTIATAMPHIESLAWHDRYDVNQGFFSMLRVSPIQHLKLSRVPVQTPLVLAGPQWSLRTLHLNICTPFYRSVHHKGVDPYELSDFVDSVLRLCVPTLERLYLGSAGLPAFMSREVVSLPRMRTYRAAWGARIAPQTLSSALTAPLTELELDQSNTSRSSNCTAVLERCDPCQRLETLIWSKTDVDNVRASINFLNKHKQVRKLYIDHSAHLELEQQIVPLLASGAFANLTSLSLSWEPFDNRVNQINQVIPPYVSKIPTESLTAIGTITSLKQLCLSAGEFAGWRCQWLVDHELLRTCLQPLQKLRRLALSRDSYQFKDHAEVERYYVDRISLPGAMGRARERPELDVDMRWFEAAARRKAEAEEEARLEHGVQAPSDETDHNEEYDTPNAVDYDRLSTEEHWELGHRNMILEEAENYAAILPRLRWIYAGQWPMDIERAEDGSHLSAVPCTGQRDSCYSLLRSMFGLSHADD